jgi:hypothetical protein
VRRVENDPRNRARNRAASLRRYGITPEQYDALLEAQDGRCAICGETPSGRQAAGRLHVDHCHETGRIRGLLCVRCNPGIGHFREREDLLLRAVEYLRTSTT